MKRATNKEKDAVLNALCRCSHNLYGVDVFTSKQLAERTGLDRCKVVQVLHYWRDEGIVERASMGCPAQFTGGEYDEMICDAAPPINGWSLTEKGRETDAYKAQSKNERGIDL